jgi:hypothetical protein
MKTKLVITDLTRMYQGRVCIAGYDQMHRCIRPTLPPPGISEETLTQAGKPIIFPFALVEFDLSHPNPSPPHTEDYRYMPESPRFIRSVQDRKTVLHWSLFASVSAIFEQPIHDDFGFYVMDCQGTRSLGTVRPQTIVKVAYEKGIEGPWDYRLMFYDNENIFYRLKITDLTWQYYCDSLRGENRDPDQITNELTAKLKATDVYLRVGLARGWQRFPDRCYLQITGIYTYPDYLEGRTFADFTTG